MPVNNVSLGRQVGCVVWVFLQGLEAQCALDVLDAQVLHNCPLHSPWGQGSYQANEDPQADPDASQAPHSGGGEERSCLQGPL